MAKKLFRIILPILMILMLVLLGCTYFSPIVGKWRDSTTGAIMEFTRTGDVIITADSFVITGTYSIVNGDVVNLNLQGGSANLMDMTGSNSFSFSISGDTLTTVGGGGTEIFYKVVNSTTANPSTVKTSSIKITNPKDGSIFHVGDTLTIKWTSTNVTSETPLFIYFNGVDIIASSPKGDGTNNLVQGYTLNTGSYKWIIPKSLSGNSTIGTNNKIYIEDTTLGNINDYSGTFTVEN